MELFGFCNVDVIIKDYVNTNDICYRLLDPSLSYIHVHVASSLLVHVRWRIDHVTDWERVCFLYGIVWLL